MQNMRREHRSSPRNARKETEGKKAAKQLENKDLLGKMIWVKQKDSWWPAQVVDYRAVSRINKPSKRSDGEVLVRLYGSYQYLYANPTVCKSEFKSILKQNNGSYVDILQKALDQVTTASKQVLESTTRRMRVMQSLGLVAPSLWI